MKSRRDLLLALLCAVSLLLIVASSALAAPLKVMPFGDSTTMGQTWVDGDELLTTEQWIASWVGYRQSFKGLLTTDGYTVDLVGRQSNGCATFADCQHEGHGGYGILALNSEVGPAISANHPNVMLVMVGTAGLVTGSDDGSNASAHLATLLANIYSVDPTIAIVLADIAPIGISPGDALYAAYNASMPGIVATQRASGQQVVLVHPGVLLSETVDGVHMTPGGYLKVATAMEGGVKALSLAPCEPRPDVSVETTRIGTGRLHVVVRTLGVGNTFAGFSFVTTTNATIEGSVLEYRSGAWMGVIFDIQAVSNAPVYVAWTATDQCGTVPGEVSSTANAF